MSLSRAQRMTTSLAESRREVYSSSRSCATHDSSVEVEAWCNRRRYRRVRSPPCLGGRRLCPVDRNSVRCWVSCSKSHSEVGVFWPQSPTILAATLCLKSLLDSASRLAISGAMSLSDFASSADRVTSSPQMNETCLADLSSWKTHNLVQYTLSQMSSNSPIRVPYLNLHPSCLVQARPSQTKTSSAPPKIRDMILTWWPRSFALF
jgi:hypothetical protein